jgi:hypothetical protein
VCEVLTEECVLLKLLERSGMELKLVKAGPFREERPKTEHHYPWPCSWKYRRE